MAFLDWSADRSRMLELLNSFPLQCEEAVLIGEQTELGDLSGLADIVVTGMGGSAMGGDLLKACLLEELKFPIWVNRDYTLPGWVGEGTLLFASSYSGNTEETLSAYAEGKTRGARVVAVTSGGELERLANEDGYPVVKVPAGLPPRCALGYLSLPMLVLLSRGGVVAEKSRELREMIGTVSKMKDELSGASSPALGLAGEVRGSLPIVYCSERLGVAATRWRTQLNENSKTWVHTNLIPELDHNEIVGWDQRENLLKGAQVVLLRDRQEHPQVKKRFEITREMVEPLARGVWEVWARGEGILSRLCSLIYFGDYVSFYLALLSGVDPTPVERIEKLKERLR